MKPEVLEFVQWQIVTGFAFFGSVIAWLTYSEKKRNRREDAQERANVARDKALTDRIEEKEKRDVERDRIVRAQIENKDRADTERWEMSEREVRALQQQMRAMELELARNYTRRENVEHMIEQFSNRIYEQVEGLRKEISDLTHHLLERRPDDPSRRR